MSSLVQPIIVDKNGSHRNTLAAAAAASYASWGLNRENPAWTEWLSDRFTKTVRRASVKDFAKVLTWCEETGIRPATIELQDGSRALALPPMTYENFPNCVSRLQVSGTDFVRLDEVDDSSADVLLYVDELLTTGKAAAQVAHALWIANLGGMSSDNIKMAGLSLAVCVVSYAELNQIALRNDSFVVIDAGLTEVNPDTLTACAVINANQVLSTSTE